jgi:hypothetical protein
MHASVIERSHEIGLFVSGAPVTLESSIVRDTAEMTSDGSSGRGLSAQDQGSDARATITLRGSLVQSSRDIGIFVEGTDLILERTIVRDTQPRVADGLGGIGVNVQDNPLTHATSTAQLTSSLVETSFVCGVAVVATVATFDDVVVRDVKSNGDGTFGDGIDVIAEGAAASATINGGRIEATTRAGIASFGATVSLGGTTLECAAIPLDRETLGAFDPAFTDVGGNACGCSGAAITCQILSSGLAPPERVSP